ncbi:hypothetical protein [Helicobacter pylori]|uniref:hypothetical protein n=1 Tax=Helicobacter pylori TaxID=210 RepID=UPI0002BF2678|nr:hypothetical protein HMPREF1432_00283 [Helicobacter pylori GAMchJs114i]WQS43933.1 hypothetical protein KVC65_04805 [Helicobacter pylori]
MSSFKPSWLKDLISCSKMPKKLVGSFLEFLTSSKKLSKKRPFHHHSKLSTPLKIH